MKKYKVYVLTLLLMSLCSIACAENCQVSRYTITCNPQSFTLDDRHVFYQIPEGPVPEGGWPVVLDFQGYGIRASSSWSASLYDISGYHHVQTVKKLLDNGFAVIIPETNPAYLMPHWETNMPRYVNYVDGDCFTKHLSSDHIFFTQYLFPLLDESNIVDGNCKFAMGFSSGGYMASRMGVSYFTENFRAIAIQSASYAAWGGTYQPVPLPAVSDLSQHPPTLFLQGLYDRLVPFSTVKEYAQQLESVTEVDIIREAYTHIWSENAPDNIVDWFLKHR